MFKLTVAAVLTSVLIAGCAPKLEESRQEFPQGNWGVSVFSDRELDEISTDGGFVVINSLAVTTFVMHDDCYVKWDREITDDTYTATTAGESLVFTGEQYDDEVSITVTRDGATTPWVYAELEYVAQSTETSAADFESSITLCD